VTLQGVLRVLNEFGAQDYITNLAGHVNGSAYSPAG